jgi:homoserine O-acetyltransferase
MIARNVFTVFAGAFLTMSCAALAADYPPPRQGDWIAPEFKFHSGETLKNVKIHYTTIGEPSGQPVLLLHGTYGSAANFLTADFAGELFGAGQPLDASKFYLIIPDALGSGKSTKPSDGLRAKFPKYDYDDMVEAQYRLVTEGLGVKHARLVIGNSMGGMQAWLWAGSHPDFMDVTVPMASQPTEMAGRNWAMRRLLVESVRTDPDWKNGDYAEQPKLFRFASTMFGLATSGGTLGYQQIAGNHEKSDKLALDRLNAPFNADANDFMYQWESSADYDATRNLEKVTSVLLAINAADDERNPPEIGVMERELKKVKNGALHIIPASPDTRGHGTTNMAKLWKARLQEVLEKAPYK